jgi:CBS domain containing-hemolysin-like protein
LTEWLLLAVGVLLTIGTAIFVAAEFSLVSVDRPAVERAVASGDRRAEGVLAAVRSLSTQLSGAQVGITFTTLVVGFLVEPSLSALLRGPLTAWGVPPTAVTPVSIGLGLFLATIFSMVFGELLPQNLGISSPLATARVVAGPQRAFTRAAGPLIRVLNGSANAVLRSVGVEPQEELSSARTPEELAALVRRSAQVGTLDESTATLLTRSLGFPTRTAADVMTPRVRMQALRRDDSAGDVVRLARRTGHSRFPVVEQDVDDVVGVVHLKTAIAVDRARREEVPVSELMSDALKVPETVRLGPLLLSLRQQGLQLAVVVDEYGGTAGVVTLEDVVEELVGDVSDEHDRNRSGVVRRRDGTFLVPGLMRPDELRDRIDLAVPDGPAYETVAGYVMAALGRVPEVGDEVAVPGAVLRVERMEGRRVDRLRVRPAPFDPDGDARREPPGPGRQPDPDGGRSPR